MRVRDGGLGELWEEVEAGYFAANKPLPTHVHSLYFAIDRLLRFLARRAWRSAGVSE